ncbi:MAG: flagellar protein FliS [Gemmataceae bacterium]|nr:flagellar protein FliS [Gemmataceae bacterium]
MNPYRAYRPQETVAGWTRIEMVLALYDKALDRLDRAAVALRAKDTPAAVPELAKVQLIVSELAAGVRPAVSPETGPNLLRLFEFVADRLRRPDPDRVADARKVLATLRDGFEAVREEANRLEKAGHLPAAGDGRMVLTTA